MIDGRVMAKVYSPCRECIHQKVCRYMKDMDLLQEANAEAMGKINNLTFSVSLSCSNFSKGSNNSQNFTSKGKLSNGFKSE